MKSSSGGLWTIRPDGTGLTKVISNSSTVTYSHRAWSPDSRELLVCSIKDRVGDLYDSMASMPAGGGKLTVLTNDLPANSVFGANGSWFPLLP